MSTTIKHNTDQQRYEISVDGILAGFTEATEDDSDVVVFPHTEIFDQFEGQGLASQLVGGALDDVRVRGKKVRPVCSYVVRFIEKHRDYADLVA
ncbi:GNAT family N-acetyltransferase [Aeromicrobium sp. SMF47]|uniref:GNAT family N-acetyltransferase n=1 Tax=Aeromicrobium yanjiei TaxID=2662028 RepID=A0A5Q2MAV6_9ACTN|nr:MULTISPECIES: GNAT family N-acetyltransferase [Aeromicrobium]MRJ75310.1 GNAT family N-acetyltransferase [Aeromicrobium yanjiei]MRK02632.1 GNAT family N-acetyltransferase [Aeromicrobium sp. S22]QGG40234.1 GNAT family N-acetyltransferase [Aeromicrobium yanjiei]